jgi:pimeloyl-ACP methyl ester carboxylesterase
MHIQSAGEGRPAVILEAGTGAFSFDWSLVQPEVARFTGVCSYDRAGQAWSELGPQPRTIRQRAYELHALLEKASIPPPYVLVGHSGGGYIVRQFQARYPKEVVGMVLAECGHENSLFFINGRLVRMSELSKGKPIPAVRAEMTDAERTIAPGVMKQLEKALQSLGPPAIDPPYNRLPPNIQRIRLWALAQPQHLLADNNPFEGEEMAAMVAERRQRQYPLGDLPLIVLHREIGGYEPIPGQITPEQVKQLERERLLLNHDLAQLSRNSAHVIARNSTHDVHLDRPELVVEAIRQVVEAARHHGSVRHSEVVK